MYNLFHIKLLFNINNNNNTVYKTQKQILFIISKLNFIFTKIAKTRYY